MTTSLKLSDLILMIGLGAIFVAQVGAGFDRHPSASTAVNLFVDKGTGCEYLVAGSSITPRLDALGYPVCPGPAEEGVEPLLPPEWKGGDAESPIYDDPMDQPLTDGMEIPGFIWDDQTQMWVRPAADDVEGTATLARPEPVFTL
jgi:hypothetical protein